MKSYFSNIEDTNCVLSIKHIMLKLPKTLKEYVTLDDAKRTLVPKHHFNKLLKDDMEEYAFNRGILYHMRSLEYQRAYYIKSMLKE